MNPNPNQDELNRVLGSIMEEFSWKTFSAILYDPARLREWLAKTMPQETETELDPDDPVVEERGTVNADTELKALQFWGELNREQRDKMTAAVMELWGKEGARLLPISIR